MDLFMTYFIYILVCFAFLIPFIGFALGATSIIKTTLATFSINFLCFVTNKDFLNKKTQENKGFGKFLRFLEIHQTKEEKEMNSPQKSHSPQNEHHIVSFNEYSFIFLTLFFLTIITVGVAQFDFGGAINIVIAMVIATFKASLVVLYFMHLKYDMTYNKIIFITAIAFVILLYAFSVFDVITRYPVRLEF